MNQLLRLAPRLLTLCLLPLAMQVQAAVKIGLPAPDFKATDSKGKTVRLSDFAGKVVILEWTNHECPFVKKHYDSGNMQSLQRGANAQGMVWLSVISSAPGKQGHVDGKKADALSADRGAKPAHVLLDPKGDLGRTFEAITTPNLYIINTRGTLVYAGAIDSIDSSDPADIAKAEPYVINAVTDIINARPVKKPLTKPYGCAIKY